MGYSITLLKADPIGCHCMEEALMSARVAMPVQMIHIIIKIAISHLHTYSYVGLRHEDCHHL